VLVEKDYWIMHCLLGLQAPGFRFELKDGTSLSKAFGSYGSPRMMCELRGKGDSLRARNASSG
jgi:hypothetical protein